MVNGQLVDDSGNPLVGYPVILQNDYDKLSGYSNNVGFTGQSGEFSILVPTPGTYEAVIPSSGFTEPITGIIIPPDSSTGKKPISIYTDDMPVTDLGTIVHSRQLGFD